MFYLLIQYFFNTTPDEYKELHKSRNQIRNWIKMVESIIIKSLKQQKSMITSNRIYNYFSHKYKERNILHNDDKSIIRQKLVQTDIVVRNDKLQIYTESTNTDITTLSPR